MKDKKNSVPITIICMYVTLIIVNLIDINHNNVGDKVMIVLLATTIIILWYIMVFFSNKEKDEEIE